MVDSKAKNGKISRSFMVRSEVFTKLKVYAVELGLPYSVVIEGLMTVFLKDPEYWGIDFSIYR